MGGLLSSLAFVCLFACFVLPLRGIQVQRQQGFQELNMRLFPQPSQAKQQLQGDLQIFGCKPSCLPGCQQT